MDSEVLERLDHALEHAHAVIKVALAVGGMAKLLEEGALEEQLSGGGGQLGLGREVVVNGSHAHVAFRCKAPN